MHMGLCFFFHPLSKCPTSFTIFTVFFTLPLSSFPSIIHSSSKGLRKGSTLGGVLGIFCNSRGTMAHSRVGSKVWLWPAVTWPLAHLSTLFGLAQEARSSRVAGKLELKVVLIGLFVRPLKCAVSVV